MTLAEVLEPVGTGEFLQQFVGRRPAIIKGAVGRFRQLVTWPDLNQALSTLRVDDRRAYLIQNARPLPESSYVVRYGARGAALLNGEAVTRHVAGGATLVVTKVDELLPAVRQLAESCERVFQNYTGVNLYAGWRTDNGFDVHWDVHDTLILQIKGQKDWTIWAPTREHPMPDDPVQPVPPTAEPFWQGILADGDVLYMPRGWWHVARPRNELSLHLTFGLRHPTGIEMLKWMVEQAYASVEARMDVPHWASERDQNSWLQSIREVCTAMLADGAIDRYMRDATATATSRPILRLQDSVTATPTLRDATPLRLTSGHRLHFSGDEGASMLSFQVKGVDWECHAALKPALALLNHIEPCTLAGMRERVPAHMRPVLRAYVNTLVMGGVIWAEPEEEVELRAYA